MRRDHLVTLRRPRLPRFGGSANESRWTVNERLANVERELRVQFTRIAQLQAELDVIVGALRRSRLERATDDCDLSGSRQQP